MRYITYFIAWLLCISNVQAETLKIVADTWCPYNCEPAAEKPGFMIEIARKAFGRHGIDVVYTIEPWTRAIETTRNGAYDAIIGASRDDAPDFIFPAIPIGQMRNHFYTRPNSVWEYTGNLSLEKIALGVIEDYSYSKQLNDYIEKNKINNARIQSIAGADALELNIKKLMAKRIDALVEAEYVIDYYLARHGLIGKLRDAGAMPVSDQDPLFMAFSPKLKNAKKYAEILDAEMKEMRQNGELASILKPYNVKDWVK